jgi:hypothetical protein
MTISTPPGPTCTRGAQRVADFIVGDQHDRTGQPGGAVSPNQEHGWRAVAARPGTTSASRSQQLVNRRRAPNALHPDWHGSDLTVSSRASASSGVGGPLIAAGVKAIHAGHADFLDVARRGRPQMRRRNWERLSAHVPGADAKRQAPGRSDTSQAWTLTTRCGARCGPAAGRPATTAATPTPMIT